MRKLFIKTFFAFSLVSVFSTPVFSIENKGADFELCPDLLESVNLMKSYGRIADLDLIESRSYNMLMFQSVEIKLKMNLQKSCFGGMSIRDSLIEGVKVCHELCEKESKDIERKRRKLIISECKKVCEASQIDSAEYVAKVKKKEMNPPSSDCLNPSRDTIYNLERSAKKIELQDRIPAGSKKVMDR